MSIQSKGNSRLLNYLESINPVDVYKKKALGQYVFLGRFQVIDVSGLKAADTENNLRLAYLFTVKPLLENGEISSVEFEDEEPKTVDAFERSQKIQALVAGDEESGKSKKKTVTNYKRNKRLVEALKALYEYKC